MRKTLPLSLPSPAPSDMSKRSSTICAERVGVVARRASSPRSARRCTPRDRRTSISRPHAVTARARRFAEARVAREHVRQPFLAAASRSASRSPYSRLVAGVYGKKPAALSADHRLPSPSTTRGSRADFDAASAFVADRVEAQARRQHQAFLRAADGDVDAPLVVAIVDRAERRDGVDQQQRRMSGRVDRAPDRRRRGWSRRSTSRCGRPRRP